MNRDLYTIHPPWILWMGKEHTVTNMIRYLKWQVPEPYNYKDILGVGGVFPYISRIQKQLL